MNTTKTKTHHSKIKTDRRYGTVYTVGINDVDSISTDGIKHKSYTVWRHIMRKVRDNTATVIDGWLHYSVFLKWYDDNYIDGVEDMNLYSPDNHYSSTTVYFLPKEVINIFNKGNIGKLKRGVVSYRQGYMVQLSKGDKQRYICTLSTEQEAADVYIASKMDYLLEVMSKHSLSLELRDKLITKMKAHLSS